LLRVSRQPDGAPEIFFSVQGEGVNTGRPAVFLRLSLCNLACTWCDTRYTWDWQQYDPSEQIMEMSPREIERQIAGYDCRYLVVTGGEPLVQQKQFIGLLQSLTTKGMIVEVETNGTIMPDPELINLIDHWSVSPKLDNSGNSLSLREIPECYRFFGSLSSSHFKYVIKNEDDIAEVQNIMLKYNLPPGKIVLMPEARNKEVLLERSGWLVELCKSYGFLFSTRLQILLWGNQRGV